MQYWTGAGSSADQTGAVSERRLQRLQTQRQRLQTQRLQIRLLQPSPTASAERTL
jgi:hypothetical protein